MPVIEDKRELETFECSDESEFDGQSSETCRYRGSQLLMRSLWWAPSPDTSVASASLSGAPTLVLCLF
jgi:hypothetical protein